MHRMDFTVDLRQHGMLKFLEVDAYSSGSVSCRLSVRRLLGICLSSGGLVCASAVGCVVWSDLNFIETRFVSKEREKRRRQREEKT